MATEFPIVYLLGTPMELVSENVVRPLRRGRPVSSGVFGEPTKNVRVPVSLLPELLAKMDALKAHVASQRPSADNPFFTTPGIDISKLRILPSYNSNFTPDDLASSLTDFE